MKNISIFIIVSIVMLFTASCEREMNIQLPASEPKLVVEGNIENDRPPLVSLSKSIGFFGKVDASAFTDAFVHGAKISVSDDSRTIVLKEYEINYGTITAYIYTIDTADIAALTFLGKPGKKYDLKIEYNGDVYTSSTTIPTLNDGLDSFWAQLPQSENVLKEDTNYRRVNAIYTDPAHESNYVRVFTSKNGGPYLAPYNSIYYDDFINGTSVTMPIDPGWNRYDTTGRYDLYFFKLGDTVDFKFCAIDKATLEFYKTLEYSYGSVGNPFVAPMVVSTNIQGGALGIWAGYGAVYYQYIVKDEP